MENNLASYGELKKRVRAVLALGRERAADAVERERVRTAWEVGKLILEHILLNQERAHYGEQVIKRLSADLDISHTEVKYMLQFARTYPIGRTSDQLTWSQIQSLLAINEDDKREELINRAEKENWTVLKTRDEVKRLKAANQISVSESSTDELLVPVKGDLNTYRILIAKAGEWKGKPVIDLGFSNYFDHPALQSGSFKEGDIVEMDSDSGLRQVKNATEADLFTYPAYVFKVTDGDTLWVVIKLGFGMITQQHVRLRGLDAPEIATRDGQEAKRFLERKLPTSEPVIITSTKSDKYDRYLADIFYTAPTGEEFLNNQLLKKRLAVAVS